MKNNNDKLRNQSILENPARELRPESGKNKIFSKNRRVQYIARTNRVQNFQQKFFT